MTSLRRTSSRSGRWLELVPPLFVFAAALGYLGADLWIEDLPASVSGDVSAVVHACLVTLQSVLLVGRRRAPIIVFAGTVVLDALILATSAGELGVGSLGVMFATYTMVRHSPRKPTIVAACLGATVTTVFGGGALLLGSRQELLLVSFAVVARVCLQYVAPAAAAEYFLGRERLADALRERDRMAERERRARAEREIRAERESLARELHDIAGHHLSGIIVSSQAALTLSRSDIERARDMMQSVQEAARIALTDLRRTVGLLRSEDVRTGAPSPEPTISAIRSLVDTARGRGQSVDFVAFGELRGVGALTETTAYRMVQESLANAARHAPSAACTVSVSFETTSIEIVVSNEAHPATAKVAKSSIPGYGLAGMRERAALIGAELITGRSDWGGWVNRLSIPLEGRSPE